MCRFLEASLVQLVESCCCPTIVVLTNRTRRQFVKTRNVKGISLFNTVNATWAWPR